MEIAGGVQGSSAQQVDFREEIADARIQAEELVAQCFHIG
ncbi:hypothetical protein HMPREF1549_00751 [Actinomyces johnsonii F0510]|uniref:Uncharacterized protein n=1 Tax=Actinomyces johnsonii F0510 TaxID=1227262 RepID=U1RP15_9ACTO|nr:hypothetical protein HMPREF1549_00751 [Actinomyces johnsonii F0510]